MPSTSIHPPDANRSSRDDISALPHLLQTPSGLAIMEIQGSLNAPAAAHAAPQALGPAYPVGRLVFPHYASKTAADDTAWHKRVYLYIGRHQRLTGEVKKLAKPMAVIRRRSNSRADGDAEELEVAEIIYYKLLFAHRPEPVGGGGE